MTYDEAIRQTIAAPAGKAVEVAEGALSDYIEADKDLLRQTLLSIAVRIDGAAAQAV